MLPYMLVLMLVVVVGSLTAGVMLFRNIDHLLSQMDIPTTEEEMF